MQNIKAICTALLKILGKYVIIIAFTLLAMFAYAYLQLMLFGRGDYLLFVSDGFNALLVLIVLLFSIIYVSFPAMDKFEEAQESQIEDSEYDNSGYDDRDELELEAESNYYGVPNAILEKIKMVMKICYIPVLLICLYWGITDYAVLSADTIKVSSPLNPHGRIYKYSDIESVTVGLEEYRRIYTPLYEVTFYDGTSVNLFGGSIHEERDEDFEDILVKFDEQLRAQGARKIIDKTHFDEYAQDLNKEFTSKVERLFN